MSAGIDRFRVEVHQAKTRLDRFLMERWPERSRTSIQKAITRGDVTVGGNPAKTGQRLKAGDEILCRAPAPTPSPLQAENIPLEILEEQDDFLVVNKPSGMVTHPAGGNWQGTLVNALLGRMGTLSTGSHPDRPGIVHRLDKGTSGVMVVAKSDRAHRNLAEQFQNRQVEKVYLALVWGTVRPRVIKSAVGRHHRERRRMAIRSEDGRPARTRIHSRENLAGFSLVEARPETGRTHQIRVHLQSIRHPVVGDRLYGGERTVSPRLPELRAALAAFRRPALHAWKLRFQHPTEGHALEYIAPLPEDFQELLSLLRRRSRQAPS